MCCHLKVEVNDVMTCASRLVTCTSLRIECLVIRLNAPDGCGQAALAFP